MNLFHLILAYINGQFPIMKKTAVDWEPSTDLNSYKPVYSFEFSRSNHLIESRTIVSTIA